ncbi:hypothetical protein Bbelb_137890 [Branchiostoma belcheri]|nr:hypothetical protein Bbelb_137890 [Branchiostoma belcheri]
MVGEDGKYGTPSHGIWVTDAAKACGVGRGPRRLAVTQNQRLIMSDSLEFTSDHHSLLTVPECLAAAAAEAATQAAMDEEAHGQTTLGRAITLYTGKPGCQSKDTSDSSSPLPEPGCTNDTGWLRDQGVAKSYIIILVGAWRFYDDTGQLAPGADNSPGHSYMKNDNCSSEIAI